MVELHEVFGNTEKITDSSLKTRSPVSIYQKTWDLEITDKSVGTDMN